MMNKSSSAESQLIFVNHVLRTLGGQSRESLVMTKAGPLADSLLLAPAARKAAIRLTTVDRRIAARSGRGLSRSFAGGPTTSNCPGPTNECGSALWREYDSMKPSLCARDCARPWAFQIAREACRSCHDRRHGPERRRKDPLAASPDTERQLEAVWTNQRAWFTLFRL